MSNNKNDFTVFVSLFNLLFCQLLLGYIKGLSDHLKYIHEFTKTNFISWQGTDCLLTCVICVERFNQTWGNKYQLS